MKCRTLVELGESCGHPGHLQLDLHDEARRSAAIERVFRPSSDGHEETFEIAASPHLAEQSGLPLYAKGAIVEVVLAFIALQVPFLAGWSFMFGLVIAVGLATVAFALLKGHRPRALEASRTVTKLIPGKSERITGAVRQHRLPGAGAPGRIAGGGQLWGPATDRPAVAYAVELHHTDAEPGTLTMASARTTTLEIALDDGRRVRIPAGPVELHPPPTVVDEAPHRLDAFKRSLVLLDTDLIPHDQVRERVLALGDRVRLANELIESERAIEATAPYRGHVTAVWVPKGIPVLVAIG